MRRTSPTVDPFPSRRIALTFVPFALLVGCAGPDAEVSGAEVSEAPDTQVDTGTLDTGAAADVSVVDVPTAIDAGPADAAIPSSCSGRADGTACTDNDFCTQDDKCKAGKCQGTRICECNVDAECDATSADKCLGQQFCNTTSFPYKCAYKPGTKVVCKGQTGPCKAEQCNPASGECVEQGFAEGTKCDDGDPCTVDGICESGVCKSNNASWCQCKTNSDCAAFADTDLCKGTLYCDSSVFPNTCKLDPTTVVSCFAGDDKECVKNLCNKDTAKCAMTHASKGTTCDDGDAWA